MNSPDQNSEESIGPASRSANPSAHDTEPLWTVQEVAHFLRLKPETVRAMARRGELPAVKLGRVWRFRRSALSELVYVER
jgi:excisionase family DNA binding protein